MKNKLLRQIFASNLKYICRLYENVAENGKYVAILKDYFHRDYRLFFSLEDVKLPQVDALHFYRILASLVVRNESNGKFQYFSVSPKYFDVPASLERLTKGEGNFKTQQEMYQKLEKFPETKMKKEIWSQIFHPPKEEFAEFEEKNEKTQEKKEKNWWKKNFLFLISNKFQIVFCCKKSKKFAQKNSNKFQF